jgi:hypothetical protein
LPFQTGAAAGMKQLPVRDARELKRVQLEVAGLVEEVHEIQREIHQDQRTAKTELLETKENVERVVRATERRRLPRVRVEFNRTGAER